MSAVEEEVKNTIDMFGGEKVVDMKGAPYTPINFDQDDLNDWLEKRNLGVGGSDAGVIAGCNHYKTTYQLFMEKTKQLEAEDLSDNERVHFGNVMEDLIGKEYARRTGRKIRARRQIFKNKEHEFMLANIDRDVVGEKRGLECKNVDKDVARFGDDWGAGNVYEAQEDGTVLLVKECDEVPESYLLQCQHYMAVMGYQIWDLAALVGGNEIRIYTIHRDEELIADLIELEAEFWDRVMTDTAPAIDFEAPSTNGMLKRMYDENLLSKETVTLGAEYLHWHEVKKQATAQKGLYEKTIECATNHLLAAAQNAGKVYIEGLKGGYTRKVIKKKEYVCPESSYMKFGYSAAVK